MKIIEKIADSRYIFRRIYRRLKYGKYKCPFKPNTIVRFDYENMPNDYHKHYLDKFPDSEPFIFIGEIVQMPGHCIICDFKTGKIYSGYHTENFVKMTDHEL